MQVIIQLIIVIIVFLHLFFLWMEMFAWETRGKKVFKGFPKELFTKTKAMAANQGLYNGFLAAGLIWSFFIEEVEWSNSVALFFLSCVSIAGIYGAFSIDKKIFFIQALPAIVAIVLILIT